MACNNINTGGAFLEETLIHIDCQAQSIGSLGFLGLSAPGSPYNLLLTTLLTIFIALFGFRLLFGYETTPRDVVTDVLKIGIVLLLATSWPAYQILIYNTLIHGPTEAANIIAGAAQLPGADGRLVSRLQSVDNAILDLTALGSGRLQPALNPAAADTVQFSQIAVGDNFALGFGRIAYLTSIIGSLGFLSIIGGILLALAPVFAGFLLFDATRGLFAGWLKGLAAIAFSSLGVSLGLSVQLALLEPWLSGALNLRVGNASVPAAPSELLAINASFFLVYFAIIVVMTRLAFANVMSSLRDRGFEIPTPTGNAVKSEPALSPRRAEIQVSGASRVYQIAQSVEASQRRMVIENRTSQSNQMANTDGSDRHSSNISNSGGRLGGSNRRTVIRASRAAARRDRS